MTNPKCKYFDKCGGCSHQNIEYQTQLDHKKKQLTNLLEYNEIEVFFDQEYEYRNRMDFIFHKNGIGLRQKGKWFKIVDIDRCEIANNKINELVNEVRSFFKNPDFFDITKQSGTLKYAVIRTPTNNSSISFVLNEKSSNLTAVCDQIKEFSKITTADNIIVTYVDTKSDLSISSDFYVVKGKDMLKESYLNKNFLFSVQGFFQNNTNMAKKMQEYVYTKLTKYKNNNAHLIDLFGGVGTFGIINSDLFKDILIVEADENSIKSAKENLILNDIKNGDAKFMDAKQLHKLKLKTPLYMIIDPPRSGMHQKTINEINNLKPEVIVYISCNPKLLAKDIHKFKDYSLQSVALFDLFPQTSHMECIIELKRK